MRGVITPSLSGWGLALALAVAATSIAPGLRAQPRESVIERRPPPGSLGRGLLPAPGWAVAGAGAAIAVVAGALLVRRARRAPR